MVGIGESGVGPEIGGRAAVRAAAAAPLSLSYEIGYDSASAHGREGRGVALAQERRSKAIEIPADGFGSGTGGGRRVL